MFKTKFLPVIVLLSVVLLWEIVLKSYPELFIIVPPPSAIATNIIKNFDRYLIHSSATLTEMVGGVLLAFIVAFPLGWAMNLWSTARAVLQPIFVIIQCIPMFTLAPIMVIWFGWSFMAIIFPTALMIFFPLTINIYQGLNSTPTQYLDYFTLNNATTWQKFYKLQLPWALPHLFAGFKISAAIAGIGAIAGEWAGAQVGLGILMLESRRAADLETSFGALFCLTLLSVGFYSLVILVEKISLQRNKLCLRSISIVACLLLSGLVLSSYKEVANKKADQLNLILEWLPNPDHVPIYVAVEKGFFNQNGIDLSIRKVLDPSDTISYLSSGQADVVVYYMPDTIQAIHKGMQVTPIGILIDKPLRGLIFRRDEGINHPKDLNDKTVGYCIDGSEARCLDAILSINRIRPSDKKNVSFDLVSCLGTKTVDAIYGAFWNVECDQLDSLGIPSDYFSVEELQIPTYHELIFLARNGSPEAQESFVKKFQKAIQESIDYCKSNPEEAFAIYAGANPDKSDKTFDWERLSWRKTIPLLPESQVLNPTVWATYEQWLLDNQVIL